MRHLLPTRSDFERMRWAPQADLLAGLTVGLVALPLALAFGITSGMGAASGLATAVVAGAVAALFGGSNVQISGPTGAMTVVLVPIVAAHGPGGVLLVGLLAGLILLGMAHAGVGRYVRFVPLPVVEGFTVGIALVISLQQLPSALGVSTDAESPLGQAAGAVREWADEPTAAAPLLAVGVAAVVLAVARLRRVPLALLAVLLATVVAEAAHLDVARVGTLPSGFPTPQLGQLPWGSLGDLVLPALAVALLAALESLLSATVADAMTVSERHDPDRELFGQGLANLASPLLGGMPATAAIARTAVNVRTGARSRLAALVHSAFLLVVALALGTFVGKVPVAALAGVLLATTVRMVDLHAVRSLTRAGRGEASVLLATVAATVLLDLVQAVLLGVLAAGAVALRRMALAVRLEEVAPVHEGEDEVRAEHALLHEHVVAYRVDGPLFFASAHHALRELASLSDVRVVVLRLSRVPTIDATGAAVLRETIAGLERQGTTVLLSGVADRHLPVLTALGVLDALTHPKHLFASTPEAIAHARLHDARLAHEPPLGV